MVCPEHVYAGVHETVRVEPEPPLNDVVPPGPVHEPVYVVDTNGEIDIEPFVETEPMPLIVQLVALVEDHVSVALWPCATFAGVTESVAVGGMGTVTVTEL